MYNPFRCDLPCMMFYQLDYAARCPNSATTWQWARRRHPKKSRDWVKKQCFPTLRNRAWTFATKTDQRTTDGKPVWLRLIYAGETKIRRHIKVRQDANPFDPQWRPYFEERAFQTKFGITRQQAGIKPL